MNKTHEEFMGEVEEKTSLPGRTKEALGPESAEDRAMYSDNLEKTKDFSKVNKIKDADEKENE